MNRFSSSAFLEGLQIGVLRFSSYSLYHFEACPPRLHARNLSPGFALFYSNNHPKLQNYRPYSGVIIWCWLSIDDPDHSDHPLPRAGHQHFKTAVQPCCETCGLKLLALDQLIGSDYLESIQLSLVSSDETTRSTCLLVIIKKTRCTA